MQHQKGQRGPTPPSAPPANNLDSHVEVHVGQISPCIGAHPKGVRSQSPSPNFPGDILSPPTSRPPGGPHEHIDTPLTSRRPRPSQPRELFRVPQRHQQQLQPSPTYASHVSGSDDWRKNTVLSSAGTSPAGDHSRLRTLSPYGNSPDEDRRRSQREKQIQYGYATDGFENMKRLIAHDPLLKSGGLLPLSPPAIIKGSKRLWDIQLRKWRRALHMFDFVFIDGEDDPATRDKVLEEQRQQWVSEGFQKMPREMRLKIDLDTLLRVRHSSSVPSRIPVEDDLRCILRSEDCYESVRSVVPQSASSLTKGTDISPLEAGIKIHIAPSTGVLQRQQAQLEMQQRLSSLHQKQQQQQQQQHVPTSGKLQGCVELNAHRGDASSGPDATGGCAPAQRPIEPSPSPRRPPLSLEAAQSPSQLPYPSRTHPTCEATPHHQRYGNPRDRQSNNTLSCSPLLRTTAATVSAEHGSVETDRGVSVHRPCLVSPLCSSAEVWRATFGGPGGMSAAAPLMPPPPLSAPLPCQVPNKWMQEVGVLPSAAPGAPTMPTIQPHTPWCSHCGQWVDGGAPAIADMPYRGICTGTASCCGGVSALAQVPQRGINPAAVQGTSCPMTSPCIQFPRAMPYTGCLSPSIGAAAMHPHHHWQMTTPLAPETMGTGGLLVTQRGICQNPHSHAEVAQDTPAAMPCFAISDRSCPQDGRHRSSGAVATGSGVKTPQTVPRFVARLSTSPSEQRLGERKSVSRLHSVDVVSGDILAISKPLDTDNRVAPTAPSTHPRVSSLLSATSAAVVRPEKSQSLSAVTPKRTLFGADTIGEVTTEARLIEMEALLLQEQERHEAVHDTSLGKRRPSAELDEAPLAPLVFDGDE